MIFFLAVGMMMLGVALCLLGPIRLPGGRVLRARHAQTCGVVMLSYLPLYFVIAPFIQEWDAAFKIVIQSALMLLCWLVALVIVVRSTRPARPARPAQPGRQRSAPSSAHNPLLVDHPAVSPAPPPAAPQPAPSAPDRPKTNVFDFS